MGVQCRCCHSPASAIAWLTALSVATATQVPVATTSATEATMKVYYWPMVGRAGHVFWMLNEAGVPYEHISSLADMGTVSSLFGANTSNLAPPIIVDGDLTLSQSEAVCVYLGEKLGFAEGVPDKFKAMQHMSDLLDLGNELGRAMASPEAMHEWVEPGTFGTRIDQWMGNVERSIVGPHYYGDKMTYVDYYLATNMEYLHHSAFDLLEPQIGDKFEPYPKIRGVLEAVRNTKGYQACKLRYVHHPFVLTEEFVEQYGEMATSYDFTSVFG